LYRDVGATRWVARTMSGGFPLPWTSPVDLHTERETHLLDEELDLLQLLGHCDLVLYSFHSLFNSLYMPGMRKEGLGIGQGPLPEEYEVPGGTSDQPKTGRNRRGGSKLIAEGRGWRKKVVSEPVVSISDPFVKAEEIPSTAMNPEEHLIAKEEAEIDADLTEEMESDLAADEPEVKETWHKETPVMEIVEANTQKSLAGRKVGLKELPTVIGPKKLHALEHEEKVGWRRKANQQTPKYKTQNRIDKAA